MRRGAAVFLIGLFGFAGLAVAAKDTPDARLPKPRPVALTARPAADVAAGATLAATDAKASEDAQAAATEDIPDIRGPYIVADAASGRVIEEFDALRPWYPASTSKLMTLYTVFKAVKAGEIRFDTLIKYGPNAAAQPASKMGFRPGTTLTLDNALKMMMVKSANDIAVAVAEAVGGSVQGFSYKMNLASQALGMTRSHWVNPHGLPDPGQVTSARDMALLARALITDFPEHRDYLKLPAIRIGGRVLKNYTRLLERYAGATGMKTGFICASGYNLVASAKRGGRELIAVVFGEYGGTARTRRAAELLDEGFASGVTATDPPVMLADAKSGEAFTAPADMREYVCGARRARVASEANEEDDGAPGASATPEQAHLSLFPLNIGPPVQVTALVPAVFGEKGFVAPIPRARPDPNIPGDAAAVMNAFAPVDQGAEATAPAEAIGAAAGSPSPLNSVLPPPAPTP
jgi:D-alanyl-D-alanine carboxypeptidase